MRQFPLLAWSSLATGFMSGKFKLDETSDDNKTQTYYSEENFKRLHRAEELALHKNVTVSQLALAYVLQQGFPIIALVGSTKTNHLDDALGAVDIVLNEAEMQFLDLKTQHPETSSSEEGI
jgi:aryl-alcohol dehydrogenase-like predicted oxidoreductase